MPSPSSDLPKRRLHDLSRVGLWEVRAQLEESWNQEWLETTLALFTKQFLGYGMSVARHDVSRDRHPINRMRDPYNGDLGNRIELVKAGFHSSRANLLAAALKHVVSAADKVQVSLLVLVKEVTSKESLLTGNVSVAQRFCSLVGALPITAHDASAANDQLANFSRTAAPPMLVEDVGLRVWHRPAH
jgi:hypothetical protein